MQGRSIDADLNVKGVWQATVLAKRFSSVPLGALYSSSLARAFQTAKRVGDLHGMAPKRIDSVSEMWWGDLEGQAIEDVSPYLNRIAAEWRRGVFDHSLGGGETILEVQERAKSALTHLEDNHGNGESVLVITHGRFLRVILATALDGFDLTRMDDFKHTNTGVYRLEYSGSGYTLSLRNCTVHLEEPAEVGS